MHKLIGVRNGRPVSLNPSCLLKTPPFLQRVDLLGLECCVLRYLFVVLLRFYSACLCRVLCSAGQLASAGDILQCASFPFQMQSPRRSLQFCLFEHPIYIDGLDLHHSSQSFFTKHWNRCLCPGTNPGPSSNDSTCALSFVRRLELCLPFHSERVLYSSVCACVFWRVPPFVWLFTHGLPENAHWLGPPIFTPYGCGSKPIVPFWGRCTSIFVYLSGDWDVHSGYDLDFDP